MIKNTQGPPQDQMTRKLGPSVRICQFNVEGISRAKCQLLHKILLYYNIDVVALQQTHTDNEDQLRSRGTIPGYDIIGATYHHAYGVATYVRNKIENAHLLSTSMNNNIHEVTIKMAELTVCNIYKPPAIPWPVQVIKAYNHPTVYTGDFNSHHTLWRYRENDANGEALTNWAEENNINLIFDTKDRGSFKSAAWGREYDPDLCFVTADEHFRPIRTARNIMPDFPHSQHRPALIEIGISIPLITSIPRPRWNFQKVDWAAFSENLDKCLGWIPPSAENHERIRQEINGGAWCPKAPISSDVKEYLEVDLQKNHLMTWTETQGRFGNGQGKEYAEAFLVEYWRSSLNQWITYKDSRGEKVLTGNSNTYLVVKQRLELPFVASKVRFIPYSEHPRTVCMRVELYGCHWEQNIIKYESPRGEIREPDVDLEDISYDGILDGNMMKGGLGQLVDGLYGDDDYQKLLQGEHSGSRWVGWSDSTHQGEPLNITFEFDTIREFNAVHLHANNMFSREVQVFSQVELWFSLDGDRYQSNSIRAVVPPDRTRESARNITVQLFTRPARFIQLRLSFADKWILLSEISFESVVLTNNLTEDDMERYYIIPETTTSATSNPAKGETTHARKEVTPATSPTSSTQAYIGLITGALAMIVLLLGCTIFLMIRRGKKKVALLHKHTALVSSSTKPTTINMKDLKHMSTPIINNGLSRSRLSVKSKSNTINSVDTKKQKKCNLYGHVAGEESDSENSSVYHEPYKLLPNAKQEYGCLLKKDPISSSKSGEYTDFTSVNSFQDEMKFTTPSFYNLTPPPPPTSRPMGFDLQSNGVPPPPPVANGVIPSENYYAATDIVKGERREQHFTPGRFTPIKLPEGPPLEGVAHLLDFPRHRLRLLEKLGEGDFGMVHLCEAEGVPDFNGGSSFHKKQLVIVKSLWRGCGDAKRHEFLRETSWLAGLRDPNLARVVGLCSQDEPMCALLEHSEPGDLPRFLSQRAITEDGNTVVGPNVSYGCLIYVATQVASGMKYLESLDLVHRDLAARNCVIDKSFTVKVSDHAMYCDRYQNDYYISDTKARLPIRWMSWEALLLGRQTTKSDVWAFACTLWEILMLCTQQPYAELTSEQVVENSNHWYQNDGCQRYLPRPTACPREIYDLMGECWKRNSTDRPRFSEIHLFLQRKNLGYMPAPNSQV